MTNEIISVNRVAVDSFEAAQYDGSNGEWIAETFFGSNRPWFIDPGTNDLYLNLRNGEGPYQVTQGSWVKREKEQEDVWHGAVSDSSMKLGGGYIFVEPSDFPGPLDDLMS